MGRRVLIALIAIIVAAAGTFFIWQWVTNYEEGLESQFETVEVFVATENIAEDTPAEDLEELVERQNIVRDNVVPGAVTDLAQISGLVTDIDILAGEQLVEQRFIDPAEQEPDFAPAIDAPEGMLEVTFSVSEERLIGGQIEPGDSVAFIASFPPFLVDTDFTEPGVEGDFTAVLPDSETVDDPETPEDESLVQTPNVTSTVVHKVLVTNLQFAEPPATEDEEGNPIQPDPRGAPQTQLYVTLAAPVDEVEKMVFVREFGTIWLALETEDDPEDASEIVTRGNIFSD